MNQRIRDEVAEDVGVESNGDGSSHPKPGWLTVFFVVAIMCIALPRSTIASGLSPILLVVSAIVLVLGIFGRE